jgi:hypothetical protein
MQDFNTGSAKGANQEMNIIFVAVQLGVALFVNRFHSVGLSTVMKKSQIKCLFPKSEAIE